MNRFFKSILPVIAVVAFASCSDNEPDPNVTIDFIESEIEYDANGVWKNHLDTKIKYLDFNGVRFSHKAEASQWGAFWNGFCPSRSSDTKDYTGGNWMEHQWDCMAGGGIASEPGSPFMVAYWNTSEDLSTESPSLKMEMADGSEFTPVSIYINNSTYCYYTMINGSPFSKKFEAGDWTKVNIYAVRADNSVSEPLEVYLLDYRDSDKAKWYALKDWTYVDLSSLNDKGAVKYIYFTMASSDSGQWGMNVPSYFAIDRPTYRK